MSETVAAPSQPLQFSTPDDGDELARAEVYGLLAALYIAAPEDALYRQLRVAVTQAPVAGAFLETSWSELVATARRLPLEAVEAENVALFGGVGKPDIAINASWYIAGALNERPLVLLRDELARLGLERPPTVLETEDHLAALLEVMRYLIAGDDVAVCHLASQQRFFNTHLRPWTEAFCDAVSAHPQADFYRALAGFTRDFLAVETEGFDLT